MGATDAEKAFEQAGLVPYSYTYPGEGPWPTLDQLFESEQRLIVMAEVEGPPPDWHHHAWDHAGETP